MKLVKIYLIAFIAFIGFASNTFAETSPETKKEAFNPKELIFEHVLDAYEWHITTIGETHISIPLPIIVISKTTGFHLFLSSNFEHGKADYHGFSIAHEGANKGKVVEKMADGTTLRPVDISITKNVVSLFVSIALLLFIFLSIAKRYKENFARAPKGFQSWLEPLIIFIRDDVAKSAIGDKYTKYLPYLLTVFFFIFLNNLLGLVPIFPGGANLTGNIAVTMVLAIFSFFLITFSGTKDYWLHMVNTPGVPWWLKFPIPLMPVLELMQVFIRPMVLMIRLFANITAGHIVALGFYCLIFIFGQKNIFAGYGVSVVSILFTIFMALIELLVCFIQAYVFTLLSALFIGMALETHEEHHEAELQK